MGCNCGGKKADTIYIYTDTKGKQTSYNTEAEAKAAYIRNGHSGSVRQAPK